MKTFIGKFQKNNITTDNSYLIKRLLMSYPELLLNSIEVNNTDELKYKPYRHVYGYDNVPGDKLATYLKYYPTVKEESEFESALRRLNAYAKAKYGEKPYDFLLEDGTPVKEYQNFIQVGYRIIPKNNYRGYYNSLSNHEKTVINNIVIVINNTINADINL